MNTGALHSNNRLHETATEPDNHDRLSSQLRSLVMAKDEVADSPAPALATEHIPDLATQEASNEIPEEIVAIESETDIALALEQFESHIRKVFEQITANVTQYEW